MRRTRVAIVGFGKLGARCAEAILASQDLSIAAILRRPETAREPLPGFVGEAPVVSAPADLERVDAALICVPVSRTLDAASNLLRRRIPIVECARLHGEDFRRHRDEIGRVALHSRVSAVNGAGWDPGALSLIRGLFALLAPHGRTLVHPHSGSSLHQATLPPGVKGVKGALATERPSATGKFRRYVYVELDKDADLSQVERAFEGDPLFLDGETFVFPVDSLTDLESASHGVTVERLTSSRARAHPHLFLEGRFDEHRVAAEVMLTAARALPFLEPGASSLFDVPPRALCLATPAEREWI